MGQTGMTTRIVVDTSVMFKWFVGYGESGLDEAWALLRGHQCGESTLIAPASAALEMANLLSYTGIASVDAQVFLAEFERAHIVIFDITPERLRHALDCAHAYRMTVYDAMFLELAQEHHCPLVTADRRAFGDLPAGVADVRLIL